MANPDLLLDLDEYDYETDFDNIEKSVALYPITLPLDLPNDPNTLVEYDPAKSYSSFPPLFAKECEEQDIIEKEGKDKTKEFQTPTFKSFEPHFELKPPVISLGKVATPGKTGTPNAVRSNSITGVKLKVSKEEVILPSPSLCTTISVKSTEVYDREGKILPWLVPQKHKSMVGPAPFLLPRKKSVSRDMRPPTVLPKIKPKPPVPTFNQRSISSMSIVTPSPDVITPKNSSGTPKVRAETAKTIRSDTTRISILESKVLELTNTVFDLSATVKELLLQNERLLNEQTRLSLQIDQMKSPAAVNQPTLQLRKLSMPDISSNISRALSSALPKSRVSILTPTSSDSANIRQSFSVTKSGTFKHADFEISHRGLLSVPKPFSPDAHTPGSLISPAPRSLSLGREDVMECGILGRGASAVVIRAYSFIHKKFVALKKIDVHEPDKRRSVFKEINTLLRVFPAENRSELEIESLPVVGFYGAFYDTQSIYLALQYCNAGSLQTLIDFIGKIPEIMIQHIAADILTGLAWLHVCKMVHRDVKPSNILLHGVALDSNPANTEFNSSSASNLVHHRKILRESEAGSWSAKLGDFGIIALLDETEKDMMAKTLVGTLTYMSPERLTGQPYSYAADIWGVGMSLITAAIGHFPIESSKGQWGLLHHIQTEPLELPSDQDFSEDFRSFIHVCMSRTPEDRWSAQKLLEHPFLAGVTADRKNQTDRPCWDIIKNMITNFEEDLTPYQCEMIDRESR